MIIIKLGGGLGNQMFQYALGRNLSLIHNVPFKIDSSYLRKENQSGRILQLNNFNTILNEATKEDISSYDSLFQKILGKIVAKNKRVIERSSIFDLDILSINDGYFIGHWNSEKYFRENADILRKDLTLKNPLNQKAERFSAEIKSTPNTASIHIRRGDYVSIKKIADTHGTIPISYYEKAIDKIIEKFPDTVFFVFSDDIEWAKENLPSKYHPVFVSDPDIPDYEELILMSLCKNNITANSTFSWWGAWLNNNPEKIIITPKEWFVKKSMESKDLIPEAWIRI